MEDLLHSMRDYGATIMGFLVSFFMAIFRTAKATGRADWIEAAMCGGFAVGFSFVPELLGLNEKVVLFAAAYIGYIGTHKISAYISQRLGL